MERISDQELDEITDVTGEPVEVSKERLAGFGQGSARGEVQISVKPKAWDKAKRKGGMQRMNLGYEAPKEEKELAKMGDAAVSPTDGEGKTERATVPLVGDAARGPMTEEQRQAPTMVEMKPVPAGRPQATAPDMKPIKPVPVGESQLRRWWPLVAVAGLLLVGGGGWILAESQKKAPVGVSQNKEAPGGEDAAVSVIPPPAEWKAVPLVTPTPSATSPPDLVASKDVRITTPTSTRKPVRNRAEGNQKVASTATVATAAPPPVVTVPDRGDSLLINP